MLSDPVIATQMNDGLKQCIIDCARAASEAANPSLRSAFAQISQDGIRRQAELARMMQQKGWYTAPSANPNNIQRLMPQLHALIQGSSGPSQGMNTFGQGQHVHGQQIGANTHQFGGGQQQFGRSQQHFGSGPSFAQQTSSFGTSLASNQAQTHSPQMFS